MRKGRFFLVSYILAIAFSILLSALYAFQNAGDIYVKFIVFERQFPQGVWEALLFSAGVVLMWIFSLFASFETRGRFKAKIKEKDLKITQLEEEKKSLLLAFNRLSPGTPAIEDAPAPLQLGEEPTHAAAKSAAETEEKGTGEV
jgi:uncharacterized membrane protein YciS (DUF1049 family)